MYVQLFNLLANHDHILKFGLFLLIIVGSLCFCTFSTTLFFLIFGLLYYGYKLTDWISKLRDKAPIVLYDCLDELIHRKFINLISAKLDLNNVRHCGQEISLENETFRISENICKDYIVPWCATISPDSSFPADAERAIFELIHAILRRLSVIDGVEFCKDILYWFQLMCSPCTRDRILLSDDEMNEFLEVCSEKVLKSCSPSLCALIDDKDKSEGFNDPLISMIKDLFCKAAIIPISDLISDPEFLNQCIARLFKIKIRDDAFFELEGINEYLQNPTEQLLIPFTNSTDGMIRSITVDTVSIVKEVVSNSSPGLSLPRLKLHKRSLSQPKNIDSLKKNSIADGLQNTQKIIDVLPCEAGIDLDSYPNPNSRVFKNIRINKWELVKNSKEMYVCYIITVDALFEELHPQKMYPSSADEETREECIVSSLIWKNLIVKHRFREFVDLQVKLENSARLRGTLRGINKTVIKPSTLKLTLNLISFNPLRSNVSNKTVIEHRRRCLEKYLNELSKFEKISRSREFRDFLGYREERSSFLRSPSQSILVPLGIDKVYRNVRDAITFLKPSNPQEGTFAPGPTLVISDSPLTCLKLTKLPHNKPSKILKIISEPRFVLSLMQSVDTKKEINSGNTSPDFCFLNLGKRSSGDGCDNSSVYSHCKDRSVKIPLVESLINIVQTIIPLSTTSWFSLILLTIKVYLGTTLERLIGALIIRICCTETFVYLLHNLHESIWEDEENDEWIKHELPSASHLVHKFVNMLKYKSLFNYLPVTYLEESVQSLFNTFQSKDHNKMFILLVLSSLLKRSQIH